MIQSDAAPQVAGPFPLSTLRHSTAHLMASAVQKLFPGAKFGFGPAIEHGFYYDFDLPEPLTEKDLRAIEKEMRRIAKKAPKIECVRATREEAKKLLQSWRQDLKVEGLARIPEGEAITFYFHGDGAERWGDLCEGPHIDSFAKHEFHFRLLNIAGAYWLGDEKRPMLQRIYGTAFWSEAELEQHLAWLEEVKQRDHRKLGTELDLFSVHPDKAGPGFVFWHANLGVVRREIEEFWWDLHTRGGYKPVYTPHVARESLFAVSGHLENYADMMYASMELDEQKFRVKPMNCPGHCLIYKDRGHSYRELPLRWAELGTVYRYERSGVVHGMLRVRGFTQDDAHIFCTPEQLPAEISGVCKLVDTVMRTFGFEYKAYLATRPEKAIGDDAIWARATEALKAAAAAIDLPLELDEGGGAFYGPKIDFKIKDALGREWQNSTIQCDFNLPQRFDLVFTASDGTHQRPIMVHRAILGSMERFVGALIEHFGGRFPFWLAPTQVAVIPIREEHSDYCKSLAERLQAELFRVDARIEPGHMNKKIKEAQKDQVPYMLIAGDREAAEGTVAVRRRGTQEQRVLTFEDFCNLIRELRSTRALELA